eukprot:452284-Pleurochrysis_carterae.AAC.1
MGQAVCIGALTLSRPALISQRRMGSTPSQSARLSRRRALVKMQAVTALAADKAVFQSPNKR